VLKREEQNRWFAGPKYIREAVARNKKMQAIREKLKIQNKRALNTTIDKSNQNKSP